MDVTIVVMDGVADFGFTALLETFGMANALRNEFEEPPGPWRVQVAALEAHVRTSYGHTVPTIPLDQLGGDLGVVVVPAVNVLGAEALIRLVSSPEYGCLLERIRDTHASGAHLAAACTGTFFLAEAGVLDGSTATTSWWLGPSFRRRYPRVGLDEGLTLCRGGRVTTAGASLSHLDLALSLVQERSPALAELVGRYLAAGNRRTQANFSIPEVVARGDSVTAAFERWVREHIGTRFLIAQAAHELGVTERSLQRATHAELGMSPRDFVDDIRLERAAHLLRTTPLTVDAVAARVGYLNGSTLRSLARRRRGMSLAELRSSTLIW
ncbi:transcriptional regulator GlxA family with amidase domain [Nocardia transvalensis]|uniref:Transcriptional regulator GlxA family with amidase domain n=1 Tax=Nocardia transvalensis TaxID=37333 RepID=A0A7W9ULJ2_9NOCA|nr:helix-turn-helix domain-containing protein [Nocardia transvalensis]MBB5917626.1 transcriptional regulator GlxA family with amidase domain [Nocardia transvalensis]